jgi:resuscitation-promoting factor RpfB
VPGTAEPGSIVGRSAKALVVHAFVIVGLVGGTTAFVSSHKEVTLTIDGQERSLHTFARTVGDLLQREGVTVMTHDKVVPAAADDLSDGDTVSVRYGRLLRMTVDGKLQEHWVTAMSVEEALEQLRMREEGAYLSASRSQPIGRQGLELELRTARRLTLDVDRDVREVVTTEPTVAKMLAAEGIVIGRYDLVSVPMQSFPLAGSTIRVQQLNGFKVTKRVEVPFEVKEVEDPERPEGEKEVETKGVKGVKLVTYEQQEVAGKKKFTRVLSEKWLRKPVDEVVKIGTKKVPNSVPGADNLNWAALAKCESGGRPGAVNPAGPYYGLYQFSLSTWQSVGGKGLPSEASADEQTYRAKLLYKRSGRGQWPVCGKKL